MSEAELVRPEPICLFDLDGTMADFDGAMRAGLASIASPDEQQTYWVEQDDEPAHVTARRRMIKRQPGFWRNLGRLAPGFQIFQEAIRLQFRNAVITKAPRNNFPAWSEKVEWCHNHLVPIDPHLQVNLVEDKGLMYGKVLVDDWPKYVLRWLEWRARGLVIMPAQVWNEGFSHPNVIRVCNDRTLAQAFERMAAARAECR